MSKTIPEKAEHIITWLKNTLQDSKRRGFIIGMSGGVDSALAGVLASRASYVKAFIMPCYSDTDDISRARNLCKKFNIEYRTIYLDNIYDELINLYGDADILTRSNLKARLRMLTLYYHANKEGLLVVGTGNKTEITLGYFTKYGDGGADILPIADLYKGEVWEMARYMEIPEEIINMPPSAGLWPGQTDEGELGFKYSFLDNYLRNRKVIEKNDQIEKMIENAKHKNGPLRCIIPE